MSAARRFATGLFCGAVFGAGLVVAGMTDPRKVLGFLDFAGDWDPSLALVMAAALAVAAPGLAWARRGAAPPPAEASPRLGIDKTLLVGSALFGIGWGLSGYCPGPAIASLASGNHDVLWFLPALALGGGLQRRWAARPSR
ncbi:DUF6691 family protein [Rubrivivax gelatinosus]|uniref:Uncharacterized protein n=1 Tax=Rubrivivax gelatinosus (strain NBRC 100245 / IL144) TaxID=983917 RepID=I0HS81_RUBGI|nr:DUF6691 family protein [Rubrivivax gelatinosus]BAL95868.1 hypothetical protein RGE_25270 [Rubrivivax gelatinosus IL144]